MYLINFLTYKKINKIYIGFADLKLLSFIMIMYGFKNSIIIYFISAYISIFPILYIKFYLKNNKEEIPYGIYIFISFYLFSFYQPFIYNFLKM
jgi:Flp pilus assembly protein protease CpaA